MELPWLNDLPASWVTKRLKYAAPLRISRTDASSDNAEYIGLENIESGTGRFVEADSIEESPSDETESQGTSSCFVAGDVLFGKLRPYLAKAFLADRDGVCSTELLVLQPNPEIDAHFLFHVLLCPTFITLVNSSTFGAKMPRANWDSIGTIRIPLPPLPEQRRIAKHLNAETAQIDALLFEKRQMLDLLQEKRTTIETRALKCGLNPKASMKPSDLTWLGDIPAHWKVLRAKWLFCEIDERTETGEETLLSLRMERGLVPHNDVSEKPIPAENLIGYKIARPGEIVLNRMRAASGLVAVTPQHGIVSPDYAVFRVLNEVDQEYFTLLFKTPLLQAVFRSLSKGLGTGESGFLRLYSEDFLNIKMPVPPFDEQKAIVAELARQRARTAEVEETLESSIRLLKKRRAALITAAVTGQIEPEEMSA